MAAEEWCFGVRRSSVERLAGCVFSKLAVTGKGVGRIVTNDSLVGRDRMSGEGRVARAVEPQCDVCNWKIGAKGASCCCWSDYDYLFRREERGEMRRGPLAVDFLLPTFVQQCLTASVNRGMMEIGTFRLSFEQGGTLRMLKQ